MLNLRFTPLFNRGDTENLYFAYSHKLCLWPW